MVGPSSSHTAGAVRIRPYHPQAVRKQTGKSGDRASRVLCGDRKGTWNGSGCCWIAGLLGMKPDDMRIPDKFQGGGAGRDGIPDTECTDTGGAPEYSAAESVGGKRDTR